MRLETPRYQRANSEDSTQAQPRGILKRKISGLVGTSRFRCYSESHLDEVGFATSSSPSLSTTTISEDQVAEFSGSGKKSVRFNEKVQQQMYRWALQRTRSHWPAARQSPVNSRQQLGQKSAANNLCIPSQAAGMRQSQMHQLITTVWQCNRIYLKLAQTYNDNPSIMHLYSRNYILIN